MSQYNIQFLPMNVKISADTESPPDCRDGVPGGLLGLALTNHLELDHACGGLCACSTCHVIVKEGFESLSEPTEKEEDMLDLAPGVSLYSRLACQAVPNGSTDLVVEVPSWNRNRVKEDAE